jgi:acylphosphatase
MKAKEIEIKGKVHDVGYRFLLLSEAEELLIGKFDARNVLVDGEQHLIVRIEGAEERIKRFVVFAESNYPPGASVEAVEVKDYGEEVRSIDSFRQSFMVFQLTKMAQLGVGMLGKQDETIKVIKEESAKTREVTMAEGEKTREVTMAEGEKTREVTMAEGEKTREVTMAEGEKTREVVETVREEVEKTREVIKEESEKSRAVMKEKIEEDVEWIKGEIIGIKATLDKVTEKVRVD